MRLQQEGCSSLQINTFFNVLPSGISPHTGGICLLGSAGEKKNLPPGAHEALVAEILGEKGDVSLKNDFMGPLLQSSKYHPDRPPEERSPDSFPMSGGQNMLGVSMFSMTQ